MTTNLIMDITYSLPIFEFESCLFFQLKCWNLSNMKFPYTNISVLTKYFMRLLLFEFCNMTIIEKRDFQRNF